MMQPAAAVTLPRLDPADVAKRVREHRAASLVVQWDDGRLKTFPCPSNNRTDKLQRELAELFAESAPMRVQLLDGDGHRLAELAAQAAAAAAAHANTLAAHDVNLLTLQTVMGLQGQALADHGANIIKALSPMVDAVSTGQRGITLALDATIKRAESAEREADRLRRRLELMDRQREELRESVAELRETLAAEIASADGTPLDEAKARFLEELAGQIPALGALLGSE